MTVTMEISLVGCDGMTVTMEITVLWMLVRDSNYGDYSLLGCDSK